MSLNVKTGTGNLAAPSTGVRSGLGIDRANYIAMRSPDPAAAAEFAVRNMGLTLVHHDEQGKHYLTAHGLDAYSLVYTPGDEGIDHVSYLVRELADLATAEMVLADADVASERSEVSERGHGAQGVRANRCSRRHTDLVLLPRPHDLSSLRPMIS